MGSSSRYYVYLMQAGPHYKIGVSKDPHRRLRELKVGNVRLRLLGISRPMDMVTAYKQEKAWFRKFQDKHVAGEWYSLDQQDVARVLQRPPDDADDFEDHPIRDWALIVLIPAVTFLLMWLFVRLAS